MPEEFLTKDAGHTPNNPRRLSTADSATLTPTQAQGAHVHRPSAVAAANALLEADDDVPLKGPLALPSDGSDDSPFLSELDAKLLREARKAVFPASEDSSVVADEEAVDDSDDGDAASPAVRQPEPRSGSS